jgi:hypothetical protein
MESVIKVDRTSCTPSSSFGSVSPQEGDQLRTILHTRKSQRKKRGISFNLTTSAAMFVGSAAQQATYKLLDWS